MSHASWWFALVLAAGCAEKGGGGSQTDAQGGAGPGGATDGCDATWYRDEDSDGHGNPATATVDCDPGGGWVEIGDDCDDGDPAVQPAAPELCAPVGRDEDCDALVDDADPDVVGASEVYDDLDGDGFGGDTTRLTCTIGAGEVLAGGDCDDANPDTNPDADEVCNLVAGDEDCDGAIDLADSDVVTSFEDCTTPWDDDCDGRICYGLVAADARWTGDAEDDEAGTAVSFVGDVNGDGLGDLAVGAIGSASLVDGPGTTYVIYGGTAGLAGPLSGVAAGTIVGTENGDDAGEAIEAAGDHDGDGLGDLLIGGSRWDGQRHTQHAWLIRGPASGGSDTDDAEAHILGEEDYVTPALAAVGDVTNDGFDDVVFGTGQFDPVRTGSAVVFSGPLSGELDLRDGIARLEGEGPLDAAGSAVAGVGDVDGDGVPDLLISSQWEAQAASEEGRTYLVLGPVTADLELGEADTRITGAAEEYAMDGSEAGDLDADGYADILVAARGSNPYAKGVVHIFSGPVASGGIGTADADAKIVGEEESQWLGSTRAAIGDLDGDGAGDLALTAWSGPEGVAGVGGAFVGLGPFTGAVSASDLPIWIPGENAADGTVYRIDAGGDFDGDGWPDLVLASTAHDDWTGAAWLVLGASFR